MNQCISWLFCWNLVTFLAQLCHVRINCNRYTLYKKHKIIITQLNNLDFDYLTTDTLDVCLTAAYLLCELSHPSLRGRLSSNPCN